jgi:hypothetical protein
LIPAAAVWLACSGAATHSEEPAAPAGRSAPTLAETRLTMGKWIETQQIISKERNEWQQGKEILLGRLELVRSEIAAVEEKIQQASSGVTEAEQKRRELDVENDQLRAISDRLTEAVTAMEIEIRRLSEALPHPLREKLEPLFQRMPEDPAATHVSAAERFQNVLGILNEVTKANSEITVHYEVRELAGGVPSEVRAMYVGLAQAYYLSARGEAGIGRPTPQGWIWEPANALAPDVYMALEILQGKHTPAFVPLPVKLQ